MKDLNKLFRLIKLAQGERTQNEYALHCNISSAAITRICLGQYDPKPLQLKKLATKAHNGVTYEMLMAAAGYLESSQEYSTKEIPDENQPQIDALVEKIKDFSSDQLTALTQFVDTFAKKKQK